MSPGGEGAREHREAMHGVKALQAIAINGAQTQDVVAVGQVGKRERFTARRLGKQDAIERLIRRDLALP